jgi:hypothetical protein
MVQAGTIKKKEWKRINGRKAVIEKSVCREGRIVQKERKKNKFRRKRNEIRRVI